MIYVIVIANTNLYSQTGTEPKIKPRQYAKLMGDPSKTKSVENSLSVPPHLQRKILATPLVQ